MYPEVTEILGQALPDWLRIPAYFGMLMTGFFVTISLGVIWAKRSRLDHDVVIDLGLVSLIAGVAGARILHVLVDEHFMEYVNRCVDPSQVGWLTTRGWCESDGGVWDAAAGLCRPSEADCFAWAKFWQGGLVWYGGLLGAGFYGTYFLYKEGFPVLKGVDMAGMLIPLGVFFGRLGCWFGGCCYGIESDHFTAVSFPEMSAASEAQYRLGELASPRLVSLPVLPTQLYEAAGCLAVAAFVMFVVQPYKRFDGQSFVVSMALYAIVRFAIEFVRDDERGMLLGLSTSQWIGLAIVVASVALGVRLRERARRVLERPLEEIRETAFRPRAANAAS